MTSARPALAIGALLLAPAAAADEKFEIYGRIDLSLQDTSEAGEDEAELQNNASRIGVRGDLPLNAGLKVIYQLEFGVDFDDRSGPAFLDSFRGRDKWDSAG